LDYLEARRKAKILRDSGGYERGKGEMNPVIFEDFVGEILERGLTPTIWEPFAGHTRRSGNMDFCEDIGVELVACDLEPVDPRVFERDSTIHGPGVPIGGVLFHPPYFGAPLMSNVDGEVSMADSKESYCRAIARTIGFSWVSMVPHALACVVCRDYRYRGQRIRLDRWLMSLFVDRFGFRLVEVWLSEPDIVIILEK
jgi:hypothetical protein